MDRFTPSKHLHELLALGRLTEDMQTIADLRCAQLAQIAVQIFDQVRHIDSAESFLILGVGGMILPLIAVAVLLLRAGYLRGRYSNREELLHAFDRFVHERTDGR